MIAHRQVDYQTAPESAAVDRKAGKETALVDCKPQFVANTDICHFLDFLVLSRALANSMSAPFTPGVFTILPLFSNCSDYYARALPCHSDIFGEVRVRLLRHIGTQVSNE
ncbi:MAG: hypothetical protein JJU25_03075 [Halomonas sp.]|nr:hypothetical protein [Halomonas sp.]MCC5881606.1 hypothetical protein [Halomonas sp.]